MTTTTTSISAAVVAARREIRDQAETVADTHAGWLESIDAGPGAMRGPQKRTWNKDLGYVSTEASDFDWFFSLGEAEQGRLRRGWFAQSGGQSPDEIGEKILSDSTSEAMGIWLQETRIVDAMRALTLGRPINPALYGGLDVDSLLVSDYRVAALYNSDPDVSADHVAYVNSGLHFLSSGCEGDDMDPAAKYREATEIEARAAKEAAQLRREAIGTLWVEGKSVVEIAELLGITRQAANQQVRKIRGTTPRAGR